MVELDQEYGVTIRHLPGVENTGADGLSRHEILEDVPSNIKKLICEVSALDRSTNEAYPVSIRAIQEAQESGDDLRRAIASDKKEDIFGSTDFNGIKRATYRGRIWVPPSYQARVVQWYHENFATCGP